MFHKVVVFSVFECCIVQTGAKLPGDNRTNKPFTLQGGLEQLKGVSRSLRGIGSEDGDDTTSEMMLQVKGFFKSLSNNLQSIQAHLGSNNKEAAAEELLSLAGDVEALSEQSKDISKEIGGLDHLPLPKKFDAISRGSQFIVENIPKKELGEMIQPKVIDDLVELSREFAESYEEVDAPLLRQSSSKHAHLHTGGQKPSTNNEQFKGSPRFDHSFQFDFNADAPSSSYDFFNHRTTSFKHVVHQHMTGFSMPSLSNFVSLHDHETVMAKHQLRQEALSDDICLPVCNTTDWQCNCGLLFDCVEEMTEVKAVLFSLTGAS